MKSEMGQHLKPYHYVPHLLPRRSYFTKYSEKRKDGLKNSDKCCCDRDGVGKKEEEYGNRCIPRKSDSPNLIRGIFLEDILHGVSHCSNADCSN